MPLLDVASNTTLVLNLNLMGFSLFPIRQLLLPERDAKLVLAMRLQPMTCSLEVRWNGTHKCMILHTTAVLVFRIDRLISHTTQKKRIVHPPRQE